MGKKVLAIAPEMRSLYEEASDVFGIDLVNICSSGPLETLNSTVVTQPATFISSLAALAILKKEYPQVCLFLSSVSFSLLISSICQRHTRNYGESPTELWRQT